MQRVEQSGIGFLGLVFIVLLVIKLTVRDDLSWLWVTVPLWGPVALLVCVAVVLAVIALVGLGLAWVIEKVRQKRQTWRRKGVS